MAKGWHWVDSNAPMVGGDYHLWDLGGGVGSHAGERVPHVPPKPITQTRT